ncbi:TetR/AcrR family transcriptional regulator [Curtobacterium sp. PhB115]|uniref:TetR/AcrR family transcriptional regulator n=1 Tax=Curtobacterium sp. PhB115 TaxID=2485173 RepID=UPI000F4C3D80|nr:TetR/AcrR family transcriptional regulator [Curtobacterium sp. PhB115]ROP65324.1 TetR family transcriptional regulator [Curtobacterium sp. PhB115]
MTRRDVARNRQALVDAARSAFTDHGLQAALEPIAVAAGLGNATLYRHFPTRAALWEAVLVEPMHEVLDLVEHCRELSASDPWAGFATFVRETAAIEARRTGFSELMTTDYRDAPELLRLRIAVQEGIDALFAAGQQAGQIRADAALADVALLQLSIATTIGTFGRVAPDAYRRWVDLALDGFRAPGVPREGLPGRPLRGDQVRRALAERQPTVPRQKA